MMRKQQKELWVSGKPLGFILRVLRGFKRNQGLLLSGALAYYTLLSIVPMSILTLIVLSHFVGEEQLSQTLSRYTGMVIPGYAAILKEQVRVFIEHRKMIGIIGFLVMLFFSSMAFSVLESAMSVIFSLRTRARRRFLVSAIIPYAYIFSMCVGILLVSFIAGALDALEKRQLIIFGWSLSLEGTSRVVLYLLGTAGEALMLTSIYLVMPVARITFHYALIGGITATILWEIARHVLVWYYSVLSMVNLIYGSFATAVVTLLTTEAAAIILLLGAQVIAELEHKNNKSTKRETKISKKI
ncbi:MAG: YihY/virulence factor BrkB family protein [Proteobacteria bacterium]|nr:YihY/virulence factor BrkB family protein [Pseudomonadota bacterium]